MMLRKVQSTLPILIAAIEALTITRPSLLLLPIANNISDLSQLQQLLQPNATTSPNNTTRLGAFDRTCNGATYGFDLSLESCADALLRLDVHDTTPKTYGIGRDIPGLHDVLLPRRYISCKSGLFLRILVNIIKY